MFLEQLAITNFRNLASQVLSFNRKINIIEGLNAQGKTNLLEAIYYLAVSRSFRTAKDSEIVNFTFPCSFFRLKGIFTRQAGKKSVEIIYQRPQRLQIKVNGGTIRRADYIHRNPVVVFEPDDLLLIKEGPSFRRQFLNLESSRLDPLYYRILKDYTRVLQQRNRTLKEKKSVSYSASYSNMQPWNEALISLGSQLIRKRTAILKNLEENASVFFQGLTASEEKLSLHYRSSVPYNGDPDRIEYCFEKRLNETARQEQIRGATLVGPHLDDFTFCIDGYDAKKFASQGQQRTAVLAIKMGEVNLFGRSADENPVVLLDDVFSEFDRSRRKKLVEFLYKREGQSFITTASTGRNTDIDGVQIFSVDKGNITNEQAGADC